MASIIVCTKQNNCDAYIMKIQKRYINRTYNEKYFIIFRWNKEEKIRGTKTVVFCSFENDAKFEVKIKRSSSLEAKM